MTRLEQQESAVSRPFPPCKALYRNSIDARTPILQAGENRGQTDVGRRELDTLRAPLKKK